MNILITAAGMAAMALVRRYWDRPKQAKRDAEDIVDQLVFLFGDETKVEKFLKELRKKVSRKWEDVIDVWLALL